MTLSMMPIVLLLPGDVFEADGDRYQVHQVLLGGKPGMVRLLTFKGGTRKTLQLDATANVALVGGSR